MHIQVNTHVYVYTSACVCIYNVSFFFFLTYVIPDKYIQGAFLFMGEEPPRRQSICKRWAHNWGMSSQSHSFLNKAFFIDCSILEFLFSIQSRNSNPPMALTKHAQIVHEHNQFLDCLPGLWRDTQKQVPLSCWQQQCRSLVLVQQSLQGLDKLSPPPPNPIWWGDIRLQQPWFLRWAPVFLRQGMWEAAATKASGSLPFFGWVGGWVGGRSQMLLSR